ncbi:MAG: MMPL family transporter [Treponema sp.]|nr:MMPL family transporter [Treponema sp.]
MKKTSLLLTNLSEKQSLTAWLVYHLGILLFFLGVLLFAKNQIKIDSDLFNLIPKSFALDSVRKADEKMTSVTGQNVFILVANPDFNQAKNIAVKIYDKLLPSENFISLSLYNDMSSLSGITDFLYKYRWNLLDQETIDQINSEGGDQAFAMNALSQAYGGFTLLPLDNLGTDPFMLTEYNLTNYLEALQSSGTAMTLTDGVLASQKDGIWYVMVRGVLSQKGSKLASKANGITEIYQTCDEFADEETHFVYSGTPYHSHQSSNAASKEISLIATISLLVVIIILLLVFRSPKPLIFSVLSILISVGVAFLGTLAVFKNMHIITLVFGTSLIGSCIDYSLHYFTHWAGNKELKTGLEIRNHLLPGLTMAIISSGICFAILLFAPFTLLKQMSLFCLIGLISSYLTTIAIFPRISLPNGERELKHIKLYQKLVDTVQSRFVGRIVVTLMFVFAFVSIFVCRKNVKIKNNLLSLYKMEGKLLADEIEASQIIQYSPSGWYLISGQSEEECLKNEEAFRKTFEEFTGGNLGYISTSLFVPSIESQKKSRQACQKLIELADYQLEALGYGPEDLEILKADFQASQNDFISLEAGNVPEFLSSSISSAWLGQVGGKYYTVLLPHNVKDYESFKALADSTENVYFISKSADISRDLDKLTLMVLKFFAVAYVLMFIMLKFFYKWKPAFKIISVPFLIILVTIAIFAICKINLEFFSVTGLILVFGLGLDYIIYMMENEKEKQGSGKILEPFATMLSFITTIISFGALALSSFQPVHLIGLAIVIGLATAYISSFFYGRRQK